MTTDEPDRADPAATAPATAPGPPPGSASAGTPSPAPAVPPTPTDADRAVPDERTLASIATPATVRRAPRIGAFIRTGVLVGALLGWVLAIVFSGTTGEGRTGAILITTAAGAGSGALLGAAVAALVDRRSTRPSRGSRTR